MQGLLYLTRQHKTSKIARSLPLSSEEHFQTYEAEVRLFQSPFFSFIRLLIDLEKDLVMPCGGAEVSGKSRLRWQRRHVPTKESAVVYCPRKLNVRQEKPTI